MGTRDGQLFREDHWNRRKWVPTKTVELLYSVVKMDLIHAVSEQLGAECVPVLRRGFCAIEPTVVLEGPVRVIQRILEVGLKGH